MVYSVPFQQAHTVLVSYTCQKGHISTRWWRTPCKIHREVRCGACKELACITPAEFSRHVSQKTGLVDWLDDPGFRIVRGS